MIFPPPPGPPPGPVPHYPWPAFPPPQPWVWTNPPGPPDTPGAVVALRWVLGGQLLLAMSASIATFITAQGTDPGAEEGFTQGGQMLGGFLCLISVVPLMLALGVALSAHGGPRQLLWVPQPWIGGVGLFLLPFTALGGPLVLALQALSVLASIPALVLALQHDVREWARPEHPQFPSYLHP